MADKSIFDLTLQSTFGVNDRLVIGNYANNDAEAILGQTLISLLTTALDGHGGISSIAKTSSSGTNPKVDTYTITYADASTSTFSVTNGVKGDTGAQTYVYLRWAHTCTGTPPVPSSWSATTSDPDDWIGIGTGTSSSAPTTVSSYKWYQYKGDKGDTGDTGKGVSNITASRTSGTGAPGTTDTYTATVTYTDSSTSSYTFQVYNGENGTGTGTVKAASYNGNVYNSVDSSGTLALSNIVASVSYNGTVYNSVDASGNLALQSIQAQHTSLSITIATSDWSNNTCTKTVTGVTASNTVIVSPASASFEAYGEAQVRATAQGANQITFACTDVPSSSLTVNVAILN